MNKKIIDMVHLQSWFEWEEGNQCFATRDHGSVYREEYSPIDLEEGERIAAMIKDTFNVKEVYVEPVDEWVEIRIEHD